MGRRAATGHADRIFGAIDADGAARSALVASWRRSSQHGLDPADRSPPQRLTGAELALARQRVEPLIRAAQDSLNRLYQAVGGAGCSVLLADAQGVPVERRGAAGDDAVFEDWGLWTGADWSEASEGTNGIGTCLVDKRLLTIARDQHFFSRNTLLSCTTAPIFDHDGALAGALDVSSCRADLTEGMVGLIALAVGDAARRIEAEALRLAFPEARMVVAPGQAPDALLAIDRHDMVVGATRAARVALGLPAGRAVPAEDVLLAPAIERLPDAEAAVLQRALARAGGNVSAAARNLGISRATLHRKLARFGASLSR